jgi:glycosyltransferase involved in cell wall biosynthesis
MRISVIIPTYKRPRTLLQAWRSLQEQTLPNFEIVVVDNAADSEVEKMVAEFNLTAKHLGCYVSEQMRLERLRSITMAKMVRKVSKKERDFR